MSANPDLSMKPRAWQVSLQVGTRRVGNSVPLSAQIAEPKEIFQNSAVDIVWHIFC
jgi:hypothetical protein